MKKILLLGSGELGKEFVIAAMRAGQYVIACDRYDNAPAMQVADEREVFSMLDGDALEAVVNKHKPDIIVPEIEAIRTERLFKFEEQGIQVVPSARAVNFTMNRRAIRDLAAKELGLRTAKYFYAKTFEEFKKASEEIGFPCVVKPVDCNSSKGVHRADTIEEARPFVEEALQLSQTKEAIIEGFCSGDEIQVDCVALDYDAKVVMTRSKVKEVKNSNAVLNSFGSVVPAQVSLKVQSKLKQIAVSIAQGFGLRNTPFFYQAIVTGSDVNVLEFAPRVGGGLSYYMIKNFVGFDAVEAVVDSFLGVTIHERFHAPHQVYRTCLLYSKACTFDHIEGLEELKEKGLIKEYFVTKRKGDVIDGDMRSSNRIGSFIVEAESVEELKRKTITCGEIIKVIYASGKDNIVTSF